MKSTVIPIWHDIAKQGDWSAGSILQWQVVRSGYQPEKVPVDLKQRQQILKFFLDLGACCLPHLCLIAALFHRGSGETPQSPVGAPVSGYVYAEVWCLRRCMGVI